MRDVINISLPSTMSTVVKTAVRKGRYGSTSEFFRDLLRAWMDERLLLDVKESQRQIMSGKGKVLRSLKDLR